MIRYTPTEAGQTEPLTADPLNHPYAMEAEMDYSVSAGASRADVNPSFQNGTAPGTEPIRENRETPPRHVRWLLAGAGLGFILGMGAMEVLGG